VDRDKFLKTQKLPDPIEVILILKKIERITSSTCGMIIKNESGLGIHMAVVLPARSMAKPAPQE
jgi:hypothetical protein